MVGSVLAQARDLMDRVTEATRTALQTRQDQARTSGEHQSAQEARQQITRLASVMGERYPDALRKAIDAEAAHKPAAATRSLFSIQFDELELMDETQVSDSVERARARQIVITAAEGPLADLDALVSATQGLHQVQPDGNPLRPDTFLQALQAVVSQMQTTAQVRNDWMGPMAQALGSELRTLYTALIAQLQRSGVKPAGYAMRQPNGQVVYVAQPNSATAPGFAAEADHAIPIATDAAGDPLLTLDRLRRLLLGEFSAQPAAAQAAPPADGESFADRFARQFEGPDIELPPLDPPATDFAITVPAAFEALQEMNQVGQMMERLGGPTNTPRERAHSLGQALSTEVVALMVDNIARDTRLLWPVQQFIRALEPALMQLALADPRFFSHKEHPARQLLQDITDRSLAFDGTEATGFQSFMRSLMNIAGPLATATVEGAQDFEQVLQQLHAKWAASEEARQQERQRAVQALEHAEQRHLMAAQISRDIWRLPDIDKVPDALSRFLLGAWAQVMAAARLADTSGSPDPGRYQELVSALIWSAQPALTRQNTGQLARLLPRLREGLASIDYPAPKTEAVFDLLMELHQQAFEPVAAPAAPPVALPPDIGAGAEGAPAPSTPASLLEDDELWVAPSEAKESGFMDALDAPDSLPPDSPPSAPLPLPQPDPATLTVGSWVNLLVAGRWERTQLSWVSTQGNLFLFTSASGHSQSMTLRLVNRLIEQGALQVITQQPVVDGALNAVAQAAMRNSLGH